MIEVTYDRYGRMNYHPDFHPNHGKQFTNKDIKYLIEWYEKIGPDQVSLDLGRTIHTVQQKAYTLRKRGLMAKPIKRITHKRTRFDLEAEK